MKKRTWKTHGLAQCTNCDWSYENYANAQAMAALHADRHEHLVKVEIALASEYDGRKD